MMVMFSQLPVVLLHFSGAQQSLSEVHAPQVPLLQD